MLRIISNIAVVLTILSGLWVYAVGMAAVRGWEQAKYDLEACEALMVEMAE